jgi:hypothetical protein
MKKLGILISLLVLSSGCATARHYGAYLHTQWKIMYHTLNNTPQTCTAIDPSLSKIEPNSTLSIEEQIAIGKKEIAEWKARQEPAPIFNLDEVNEKLFEEVEVIETKILASLRHRYEDYGDLDIASVPIPTEPEEPEPVLTSTQGTQSNDDPFGFDEPEPILTAENEPTPLLDLVPEDYVAKEPEKPEHVSPSTRLPRENKKDATIFKAEDGSHSGELCVHTGLPKTVLVEGHYEDGKYIQSEFIVAPEDIRQAAIFDIAVWIVVIICVIFLISCIISFAYRNRDEPTEIDSG